VSKGGFFVKNLSLSDQEKNTKERSPSTFSMVIIMEVRLRIVSHTCALKKKYTLGFFRGEISIYKKKHSMGKNLGSKEGEFAAIVQHHGDPKRI